MRDDTVNIMLDLETLGTKPGCVILSIGATTFTTTGELELDNMFYAKIDIASSKEAGFFISKDTMGWWQEQEEASRLEAFSGTAKIADTLKDFTAWYDMVTFGYDAKHIRLWGNGASFDEPILQEAYKFCNLQDTYPINFRSSMCYRTLVALFPELAAAVPYEGIPHNAIQDAINQAKKAHNILRSL